MLSKQSSIHTFCNGSQSRRKCIHRRTHITQYTESRALSTSARPLRTIGALSYEYCRNERNQYLEYWWDYRVTARGARKGEHLCAYYCCTRVRVSQVHREKRGGFEINSLPQRTGPSRSAVVPWIGVVDEYEGWLYGMEYGYRYSLSLYTASWFSLRAEGIITVL